MMYEYILHQMSLNSLRKVDQEFQGACMSIFLSRCLLKTPYPMSLESIRKLDQEPQGGYMSIFLTKCFFKA